MADCKTYCQGGAQNCSGCQAGCQKWNEACENECQTGCQVNCQYGCQKSCQSSCEKSCQSSCEKNCQYCERCEGCQTNCEKQAQSSAPSTPSDITVSQPVRAGGQVTISWGSATDTDNDLRGYILYRVVDGSTRKQLYKGTARSFTDTVDSSWQRVSYYVTAYDSKGAVSGQRTSPTYDVLKNVAPIISGVDADLGVKTSAFNIDYAIADIDAGDKLTVTERINGVVFKTLANATQKSYTLTITDEMLVSYEIDKTVRVEIEVRDDKGNSAFRRYSFVRKNNPPVIEVVRDLGNKTEPFNFTFKATNVEGDAMSATLNYRDKVVYSVNNVEPGKATALKVGKVDFATAKQGENFLVLSVKDDKSTTARETIKFNKALDKMWYAFKKEVDKKSEHIVVTPKWTIADGAEATIEVSNNANDNNPKWEKITAGEPHSFSNSTKTASKWAIGIRLTVKKGTAKELSKFSGFGGAYK